MILTLAYSLGHMADGDKASWGSIIGGALGAFGAFIVALFAVIADRKTRKIEFGRSSIREYRSTAIAAEAELNQVISVFLKSERLLNNCIKLDQPGNYMMNLPRTMDLDVSLLGKLRNSQLINEWLSLSMRIKINNQLIEDFNAYYATVRNAVHARELSGGKINAKAVTEDHKILQSYARGALKAVRQTKDETITVLALLQLHGDINKSKKTKFKPLEKLNKYEFNHGAINERAKELKKLFTAEAAFKNI